MKGKRILLMMSATLLLAGMPAWASEVTDGTMAASVEFPQHNEPANSSDSAEGFVSRLYQLVLGRQPDAGGLNAWTNQLVSGQATGAQVANGFIYSTELKGRNLSNSDYVEMLYQTFLNRPSDAEGKASWVNLLEKGMSREYIYKGFANSGEFQEICDSYGIQRGEVVLTAPKDQNQGVTMFIYRCYEKFLGRKADDAGLNDWANELLTGRIDAKEAAKGFVLSSEFQQKNLSNADYVKTLYRGLFDREADSKGLSEWTAHLDAGNSREAVFYGFADSDEFRQLAASFGLNSSWAGTPVTYVDNTIFKEMPSEYTFSSGAGGWATQITLNDDGTFTGHYSDSDMGDRGSGYPRGTVYICDFRGKFTQPQQIDAYTYSMRLEYLSQDGTVGDVYYEDGIRYIVSSPYGFDNADEFFIYRPGIPMTDLPEGFRLWLSAFFNVQTTDTLPYYGIYNAGGEEGFVADE